MSTSILTCVKLPPEQGTGTKSAALCRSVAGMDGQSVYLCPAPLYHTAPHGWVRGVHELGATLVVMEKFDLGVTGVIMNGATPDELAPVVAEYRKIRPAAVAALPANPGRAE